MTVLDTFFLLFKSDAGGVRNDMMQLEKQIDQLREKGKKRSEQENKDLKEKIEQQKKFRHELEESNNQADKMVEKLASAAAGYLSFTAIKAGIVNTAEMNRQLKIQTEVLGINSREMRTYTALFKQMGANESEVNSFFSNAPLTANRMGMQFLGVENLMKNIRETLKGKSPEYQRMILQEFGVPQGMWKGLMPGLTSDDAFEKLIEESSKLSATSKDIDDAAENFGSAADKLGTAMRKLWGTAGAEVLPTVTKGTDALTYAISAASENKTSSKLVTGGAGLASAGAVIAGAGFFFPPLLPIGVGMMALGGGTAAGALGTTALEKYSRRNEKQFGSGAGGKSGKMNESDMSFWMSQGYSREQAAVLASTAFHESGTNPLQWGDLDKPGKSMGLIQWRADRRADILRGTGIDVTTADRAQQREALAWEMKNIKRNGWSDQKFRNMKGIGDLSSYYTGTYVSPADAAMKSIERAQTAIGIHDSFGSGGGSNSVSVKIDKIDVNTQATDAEGIAGSISDALDSRIRTAGAQLDTGGNY